MNLLLAVKNKIDKRYGCFVGVALLAISMFAFVVAPAPVAATNCNDVPPPQRDGHPACAPTQEGCEDDGGVWRPETESCFFGSNERDPALEVGNTDEESLIEKYVNPLIAFLAAVVGLVVTISIVIGGIQYSSAGGDPQKVAKAKGRIINALIALIAFLFLFTFLEWIVPGGII